MSITMLCRVLGWKNNFFRHAFRGHAIFNYVVKIWAIIDIFYFSGEQYFEGQMFFPAVFELLCLVSEISIFN